MSAHPSYAAVPSVDDPDAWEEEQDLRARQRARFAPGGSFILDAPTNPEPVWGQGNDVLWSRGESCILTGGIGAGKTTLSSLLVRARLGITSEVLGYPVTPARKVLYLACDRPRQIARNLRRTFRPSHRDMLNQRLHFWPGPPPQDLARHPDTLRRMADTLDLGEGDCIVIDGLKDVALKLTDDEVGAGLNRAMQMCLRDGIDVLANHHQRKAQAGAGAGKPKSLADVYGSTWLTAGAGTVVLLWADSPGAAYIELSTLKAAAEPVGPLTILHDLDSGSMRLADELTVESVLRDSGQWASVPELCRVLGADDRNGTEKVRRRCQRLVTNEQVEVADRHRPEGGKPERLYRWLGLVS